MKKEIKLWKRPLSTCQLVGKQRELRKSLETQYTLAPLGVLFCPHKLNNLVLLHLKWVKYDFGPSKDSATLVVLWNRFEVYLNKFKIN